jgi:ribose/xylose/arabinose/galactoside ABC-type transport system permease subunit
VTRPRLDPQFLSRVGLAAAVFLVFSLMEPRYASAGNAYAVMEGFTNIGLAALGVAITIICGEFDLSIPSVALVAGVIAVLMSGSGLIVAVVAATLFATVFGLAQGALIAWLRINSILFTVGTFIALQGLAYILADEKTVAITDFSIAQTLSTRLGIFSPSSLVTLGVFVGVGAFLAYTRYGRELYAVGGGRTEAVAAGVPLWRPIVVAFTLSGLLAGLTGAIVSLKIGSASPAIGFQDLLLPCVTAALIGGVSLLGGRGSALGIFVGVLTIRFISSGLSLQGLPLYVESLAIGALLLVVIVLDLVAQSERVRARWSAWRGPGASPPGRSREPAPIASPDT